MAEKKLRDYFREIQPDWTDKEVRNPLGGPDKIEPDKTGMVVWTYGQWPFAGKVKFKDGKVVGLKLPFCDTTHWF